MQVYKFSGTYYNIGYQLGLEGRQAVHHRVAALYQEPPNRSPDEITRFITTGWRCLRETYPQVAEECRGIARGAAVSLYDLMLLLTEELYDQEDLGCTDIAALGSATVDGRALMGHNNDEPGKETEILHLRPTSGPAATVFTLGMVRVSAGANSSGLVLGGNMLLANDVRPGIPRLLLVRAMLDCPSIERAQQVTLDPRRASNYNNVLGDHTGRILDIEGSGTDARFILPQDGVLSHSNHYLHPEMQQHENRKDWPSTLIREQRACSLVRKLKPHSVASFQRILRDHQGYPGSICRHELGESGNSTVFSTIFEIEKGVVWYCQGPPCQTEYEPLRYAGTL